MIDKPRATILQLKHAVLGLVENVPFIKYKLLIILLKVGIIIQRSSLSGKLGKLQITVVNRKVLDSKFSEFEEFSR